MRASDEEPPYHHCPAKGLVKEREMAARHQIAVGEGERVQEIPNPAGRPIPRGGSDGASSRGWSHVGGVHLFGNLRPPRVRDR